MAAETDNARVAELHAGDQTDRQKGYASAAELAELAARDLARRKEVRELMGRGEVNTPVDLYRCAVVFLHGSTPADFVVAHRLATLAAVSGHQAARWLTAASLDRLLMSVGLPQTYGTQFEAAEDGRYQLRLPIDDSAVLSFEKRFYGVPTVMERLAQLNSRAAG